MENHPGPLLSKQTQQGSSEKVIINRLQNVKLSVEDSKEFWSIRGKLTNTLRNSSSSTCPELFYNFQLYSEDELYVSGNTAIWHRGSQSKCSKSNNICYSFENPIQFAIFCPMNYITSQNNTTALHADLKNNLNDTVCICLIGKFKIQLILNNIAVMDL